jgi:hypothetical protein
MGNDTRCSVEGCENPQENKKRALCNTHYLRWLRHKDLNYDQTVKVIRFWAKVQKGDGCWEWLGNKTAAGYGQIVQERKRVYAHRFSYVIEHGEIDSSLVIDHLCKNPGCVRPSHLELVTQKLNSLRGDGPTAVNARKTHCKRDHPLSGDNLVINSQGSRQCRKCNKLRSERRRTKDA